MSVGAPARPGLRRSLPSRFGDRDGLVRRIDWVLVLAVVALSMIGAILVWSATRSKLAAAGLAPNGYLTKDMLNIGIGMVVAGATTMFDYRVLRAYAMILYGLSILGLLAVLSPLGVTINGAHSWIALPAGFSVQPAEFAKLGLVLGLGMLLAEKRDTDLTPRGVDIVQSLALALVPIGLILLQPDLGEALIILALLFGVIAVAGTPARWLVGLLGGGILVAVAVVQLGILKSYQLARLTSFLHPGANPTGTGYNTQQARITIGSGGLLGTGLFHGPQTQGGFVPFQQTDFIFTVAGEELGFVGSAVIILLIGIILWRGVRIATRSTDMFGRLLAVGIVCWLTFEAFENIGMTLGIMPVTGVPLPFVSYGGSAMLVDMVAIGLLLNVRRRSGP
ncbi:MAG: rod shape-determining protein RodA [Actinomycetes bacterium]